MTTDCDCGTCCDACGHYDDCLSRILTRKEEQ